MKRIYLDGKDWQAKEFIGLDWELRRIYEVDRNDTLHWFSAEVPGSVAKDLLNNELVADLYYGLNSKAVEWIASRTWAYRKSFHFDSESINTQFERTRLVCKGLDYGARIFLNGQCLGRHQSQFCPFVSDITEIIRIGKNDLVIILEPAPEEQPQVGRSSLVRTHKTRMSYWWDFAPRLPHLGIWDQVYIDFDNGLSLDDFYLYSTYDPDSDYAIVNLEINTGVKSSEGFVELNMSEITIKEKVHLGLAKLQLKIQNPNLWYPAGLGDPYLYSCCIRLYNSGGILSDEIEFRHGIRTISWQSNPSAENLPPYTMVINGEPTYIKGVNIVPRDVLYGATTKDYDAHILDMALSAGVFLLRIWGGGLIEKDDFYDACAERGILLWQEFIQSSSGIDNTPPDNPEYLVHMLSEAGNIIKRKRNHTALALWCGGNELQDQHGLPGDVDMPLLAQLEGEVARLDPMRRFLPTSPYGGQFLNTLDNNRLYADEMVDVHGPWEYQGIDHQYELYNEGHSLVSSEFAVEASGYAETIRRTIPEEYHQPRSLNNLYYFHRGHWWLKENTMLSCFGEITDLDIYARASQFLQYDGLKYALEAQIRRAPRHSASLPWQLNEPYPNANSTCLIDYYGEPKAGYYALQKAYRKFYPSLVLASPRFEDELYTELFLHAETSGNYLLKLAIFDEVGNEVSAWTGMSDRGKVRSFAWCNLTTGYYLLRLYAENEKGKIAENEYMVFRGDNYRGMLIGDGELATESSNNQLILRNKGNSICWWVQLRSTIPGNYINGMFSDNYFCLLPGEVRIIDVDLMNVSKTYEKVELNEDFLIMLSAFGTREFGQSLLLAPFVM